MEILSKVKNTIVEYIAGTKGTELTIKTNLKNKTETFKMLALADTLRLPLLLKGEPGVGKTNCVRDYAAARVEKGAKLFILETDESTKPAEIKGRPNIKKLAEEKIYEVISPIVDCDIVFVNEIDKASGGTRNSLMSIMNEKKIFTGVEEVDLKYDLFVGTCNAIPKDETKSPLWDRFILKHDMNRLSQDQIMDYFKSGHKEFSDEIKVKLPSRSELGNLKFITESKMKKLVSVIYEKCSDRTISYLPLMVKAVSIIWECNVDSAAIKTAEILVGPMAAKQLADQITTKEMQAINNKIDMIHGISDIGSLKRAIHEVNVLVTNYAKDNKINPAQISEVEELLTSVLKEKNVDINELRNSMGKLA